MKFGSILFWILEGLLLVASQNYVKHKLEKGTKPVVNNRRHYLDNDSGLYEYLEKPSINNSQNTL